MNFGKKKNSHWRISDASFSLWNEGIQIVGTYKYRHTWQLDHRIDLGPWFKFRIKPWLGLRGLFGALDHHIRPPSNDNLQWILGDHSHGGNDSHAICICVCACGRRGRFGKKDDSRLALLCFPYRQLALMHVGLQGRLGIPICCLGEFVSVRSGDQWRPIKGLSAGAVGRGRRLQQGRGISISLRTGRNPEISNHLRYCGAPVSPPAKPIAPNPIHHL